MIAEPLALDRSAPFVLRAPEFTTTRTRRV